MKAILITLIIAALFVYAREKNQEIALKLIERRCPASVLRP